MRIESVFKHSGQAVLEGALVSLLVVGLMAGTAFAGKPAATTAGGIRVTDGVYAETTDVQAAAAYLWAHAKCSQNGVVVYEQWIKTDATGSAVFQLGPTPMWSSGAASCWAEDGSWSKSRWRSNSSTTFSVSG